MTELNDLRPATDSVEADGKGTYRCGTLTYTKRGLAGLFMALLWGDFCYTVMESVTGPIMQLKFLRDLGATNFEYGLFVTTLPGIIYAVLNPVISFKSDRHRGKRGRRIPFILFSLPFLVVFLVALGFSDHIGFWIHSFFRIHCFTPFQVIMWTTGILLIAFTIFNSFVTSVFWYLFNDVVPEPILARFMSWFRMMGLVATSAYKFFIFPYSGSHALEIFVGAAILYLFGFGVVCFEVKEGQYPPPPKYVTKKPGRLDAIATFAKECHSHKHYWYLWIGNLLGSIGGGVASFSLVYSLTIGLTEKQIGVVSGLTDIVGSALIVGSGWLADRYHPIRVVLVGVILATFFVTPANLIWLFWHPSHETVFFVSMLLALCITAPINALVGVWDPPLLMRLFPRERYGQFCSTNAMWRTVGGLLGGMLAGEFLDIMTVYVGKEKAYLYIPVWQVAFSIPGLVLFLCVYKSWKKYGADAYVAPIPESLGNPMTPQTFAPMTETV